ncbi:SPOPL.2 family protein [Megaselia abdita]
MGAVQSTIKKFKSSVIWTIKNASQLLSNAVRTVGKYVDFEFSTGPSKDSIIGWKCKLFPFGNKAENKEYVAIFLYLNSSFNTGVDVEVNFTILDKFLKKTKFTEDTGPVKFNMENNSWGFPQFIKTDELLKKSNNLINEQDEINVLCEVNILDCQKTENTQNEQVRRVQIVDDFTRLLSDYRYSDVMLGAEGLHYKAHKAILSARSPIFSAMFDHDMVERESNTVNIPDISANCLKQLLLFIYTGECEHLDELAGELFKASTKYQLDDLRKASLESLRRNLDKDVAARTLLLADTYGESQLKSEAMTVIRSNPSYIMKTAGWQDLKDYPDIMSEICEMLVKNE